ncbi:unnamed product [Ostreococcus tauri]|uniref:Unnamed product n=1 Tax=Ostreococcus tauri TaxID=70448 RepID=A0A090M689_OSTTA|nr:unnamed product [Ostreococcus tauri]CEF98197.1 unnamed product [Ostreococcus tauri]|eukprot:XP_022839132.1 unnamed product [Ostreococcus tauri]
MDNDPRTTERTEPVTRETQHPPRAASEGNRAQNSRSGSSTETKPRAKGRPLGTTRKMRRVTPGSSASIQTLTERIRTIKRERVLPVLARIAAHEDAIARHRESTHTTHTTSATPHTTTHTTIKAPAENAFIASESDDVD